MIDKSKQSIRKLSISTKARQSKRRTVKDLQGHGKKENRLIDGWKKIFDNIR